MKLSILIPSKRPSYLQQFIKSLKENSNDFNSLELVILEDSAGEHMMYRDENFVRILHPKTEFISELLYECFASSTGDWIMFGNDDLVMETKGWDSKLDKITRLVPDNIAMFYPNDTIFGRDFPCFPIVSRRVLETAEFFPLPNLRKYKVDDCLIQIMPPERIYYLHGIILKHLNVIEEGSMDIITNKWGYRLIAGVGNDDHETFVQHLPKLFEMRKKLQQVIEEAA